MESKITNIWTQLLGTSESERCRGLEIGSDGSIYISGFTEGDLDGHINNGGTSDLFISKFDSNGVKQWTKLIGNTDNEEGGYLTIGSDGSIYIGGTTNPSGPGNQGTFICKLNSNGEQQWLQHYGLSDYEEGSGLTIGSDDSIYFSGYTYGNIDNQLNNGSRDAFIRKINPDGSLIWTRLIGSSEEEQGNRSTIGSDGSIYLTGYSYGDLDGQSNSGGTDAFLTKLNSNGDQIWTQLLGTNNDDNGIGLTTGQDGSIYLTGSTNGELDGEIYNGGEDAFLTKFNPDGTKAWTTTLGSITDDVGLEIRISAEGSTYLCGYTEGDLDNQTHSGGIGDLFISKFDSNGNKQWTQLIGAVDAYNVELSLSTNGTIYIAGNTSGNLNGQSNNGNSDAFIASFSEVNDSQGLTIDGTALNDTLNGTSTNDTINGLRGNDITNGGSGDDVIDGGAGSDTSVYSGTFSDYSFTRTTSSLTVSDQRTGSNDGTDTLSNIEYIQFSDQTVEESKVDVSKTYAGNFRDYKFYNKGNGIYEIKNSSTGITDDITGIPLLTFTGEATTSSFREVSGIADIQGVFDQVTGLNTDSGEMFRLYNAAFARFPDADGLEYWIEEFSSGRNTRRVVAESFLLSEEFGERYGTNVSNAQYVETLYINILGREYDQEGYNYWLGNLNSGLETRYELLLGFAENAENLNLFTEMTGLS